MTIKANKKLLDTNYHNRRLTARLKDPEFRAEYERAQADIAWIDARSTSRRRQRPG